LSVLGLGDLLPIFGLGDLLSVFGLDDLLLVAQLSSSPFVLHHFLPNFFISTVIFLIRSIFSFTF